MQPIRRILVACDFSTGSQAAVERATALARAHGACIELVHAFDANAWQALRAVFDLGRLSGRPSPEAGLRERLAERASDLAARTGLAVESHFGVGAPATVIEARAKAMHAALLVIARRSEPAAPGVSSTLLRILRNAPCPVLVARTGGSADYARILIAADLREVSRRAAAVALALFPAAAHRLLYVIDPQWEREVQRGQGDNAPLGDLIASMHGRAQQQLAALAAELSAGRAANMDVAVVEAIPALGIVQHAATWPADCVVVGRHGQGAVADVLLGSTALDAIHHSGRDVLVVS
jgi:nucleotide-binding universal stress UspA family protein